PRRHPTRLRSRPDRDARERGLGGRSVLRRARAERRHHDGVREDHRMNAKALVVAAAAAALLCTSVPARAQGRAGSDSPGQQALADAMKAFESDDYATAEAKFKEAIGADSTLTDAYWKLAAIYYRNKKYRDAIAVLRRCPDQQNLDVREQLGLSLYRSSNPPPAEA